jgi:hypothetical protein
MGMQEVRDWELVFSNVDCIRVMMYLAKYNPNKFADKIMQKLRLSSKEFDIACRKLMNAQMLDIDNGGFTLKDSTLLALDNFLKITQLCRA